MLRINSQLNERLLQPPRSRVSPSTRHSYSSMGSYSNYVHPADIANQHSSTFIHNSYKSRTPSYMPSSRSSPRKSGSPQTRNILPSMITTQYAAQLSETKSYHPTMGCCQNASMTVQGRVLCQQVMSTSAYLVTTTSRALPRLTQQPVQTCMSPTSGS